jgi:hypothetical protein
MNSLPSMKGSCENSATSPSMASGKGGESESGMGKRPEAVKLCRGESSSQTLGVEHLNATMAEIGTTMDITACGVQTLTRHSLVKMQPVSQTLETILKWSRVPRYAWPHLALVRGAFDKRRRNNVSNWTARLICSALLAFACVNLSGRESFARLPSPRPERWQLAEMIYDGGLRPGWQDWGWGAHEISAGPARLMNPLIFR